MTDARKATGITRGYAVDKKGEERLKAAGVKSIYRAWEGQVPGKFKLRKGETLGVVDGLRTFGDKRAEMVAAVKLVKSWGAFIVDISTGESTCGDGVEMLNRALAPPKVKTPKEAAAMQAKSVKSRLDDGRMNATDAYRKWRDTSIEDGDMFREITGWPASTAYAKWGPRFAVVKRPRKHK